MTLWRLLTAGRGCASLRRVHAERRQLVPPPLRFCSKSSSGEREATEFCKSIGYEDEVATGIVKALRDSGVPAAGLTDSVKSLAGRWEVGEDAGLESLADAVRVDIGQRKGLRKVVLNVYPPGAYEARQAGAPVDESRVIKCTTIENSSIRDVVSREADMGARTLAEFLECACSGIMACSTCQVIVDPDWYDRVGEPDEPEQDMLDLAYEPKETSRDDDDAAAAAAAAAAYDEDEHEDDDRRLQRRSAGFRLDPSTLGGADLDLILLFVVVFKVTLVVVVLRLRAEPPVRRARLPGPRRK
eukprot:scaffold754_cov248-Pinguiococcus_pyrenoidosus.AAC.60